MNEKQIKRKFEDMGLKIADVAREMQAAFPTISEASADVMLRQLISGERWYPNYANWLNKKYRVTVDKPQPFASVRQRMKIAA